MSKDLKDSYVAINAPFYCRTVSLQMAFTKDMPEKAHVIMYMEAWESDPLTGAWSVQEVNIDSEGQKIKTYSSESSKGISFEAAMEKLSYFESTRLNPMDEETSFIVVSKPGDETTAEQARAAMDMVHYIAYAEREGLLFDSKNNVHTRPNAQALPENAEFDAKALERANTRWDGQSREGHYSPIIAMDVNLSRLFASASANKVDPAEIIDRKVERRIEVLNRFMIHLESCYKNQKSYVDKFRQLGMAHYIVHASEALDEAESLIKKEFAKVDMPHTDQFQNFIDQQRIYLLLLHAQGLQTLNNENLSSKTSSSAEKEYATNSESIAKRLIEAEKLYKKKNLGASDTDIENMKRFTLTKPPAASEILAALAKDYEVKRDTYMKAAKDGNRLRSDAIIPLWIKTGRATSPGG